MSYVPSLTDNTLLQPKVVIIRRNSNQGFGFTLRHFIAYPPEDDPSWLESSDKNNGVNFPYLMRGMETIFIKEVHPNSPAFHANLKTGDRILMVNQTPISGLAYSTIVSMIKQSRTVLTLHVVPKECDILQMHYDCIAHTPETNRSPMNLSPGNMRAWRTNNFGIPEEAQNLVDPNELRGTIPNVFRDEFSLKNSSNFTKCGLDVQMCFRLLQKPHEKHARPQFPSSYKNDASFPATTQQSKKLYSSYGINNTDSMVRLRQSIKQKEEFLKFSALQDAHSSLQNVSSGKNKFGPTPLNVLGSSHAQEDSINVQSVPHRSTFNYGELNERVQNISLDSHDVSSEIGEKSQALCASYNKSNAGEIHPNLFVRNGFDLPIADGIQNAGVTNKVFERKLADRFHKGFDPFKELTINTSVIDQHVPGSMMPKQSKVVESPQSNTINNLQLQYYSVKDEHLPIPLAQNEPNFVGSKDESVQNISKGLQILNVSNVTLNDNFKDEKDIHHSGIYTGEDKRSVCKRSKHSSYSENDDKNKHMRRISYLRATNNLEQPEASSSVAAKYLGKNETIEDCHSGKEIKILEPDVSADIIEGSKPSYSCQSHELNSNLQRPEQDMEVFESELEMKSTYIYGKRFPEYRSWKLVKIQIKGETLTIFPNRNSKIEHGVINIYLRDFMFCDESIDKKKNVFRMFNKPINTSANTNMAINVDQGNDKLLQHPSTNSIQSKTDIQFKAKNYVEMKRIFGILQWKCSLLYDKEVTSDYIPIEKEGIHTISCAEASMDFINQAQPESSASSSTTKYDTDVSNSTSPSRKTRKASCSKHFSEKELGSPKSKNWKDLLFRRSGVSSNNSDIFASTSAATKLVSNGSIGVPLKSCPMSKNNLYLPRIVEVCTNIVETKGLDVIGIYRIPGNKAAISELSEQVNRVEFSWDQCETDVRWEDVNVVSSLLKLFIRSLPDALLPSPFYNSFIEADKKTGFMRVKEIKDLMTSLPVYCYETLKHLIRHLNRISQNCEVNLMEPKNLAIIFGPSIIRTPNDTLEIAVKDMKHQCRIVELLVSQYEYFFENGLAPNIWEISNINKSSTEIPNASGLDSTQEDQTNMLLGNVSKIERLNEKEPSRTSRFIPQLRRRTQNKRVVVGSDTYSGESVLSLESNKLTSSTDNNDSIGRPKFSFTSSSNYFTTAQGKDSHKKKDRLSFLASGAHLRKINLDEKNSEHWTNCNKILPQRCSTDVSVFLTDDESLYSHISDTDSMSLTTITDTLDSKLKNLRSGSESNDENESPGYQKNCRHTLGQPLNLHSENIPFADESPERQCNSYNSYPLELNWTLVENDQKIQSTSIQLRSNKLQLATTASISMVTNSTIYTSPLQNNSILPSKFTTIKKATSSRNFNMGRQHLCSDDDSEGSTTSNPKESLVLKYPLVVQERYNKKRRDHRLCRSASFNCRNHIIKITSLNTGQVSSHSAGVVNLTKDEKTDMNLTKKRQIQIKQNRSIKRRHTVGGPHDYTEESANINCNQCSKRNFAKKKQ